MSAYLGQKSSNFPTARYQKDSHYLEFSLDKAIINNQTTAISTASAISLETKEKDPNNPILFYRNILKDIDVNYQITKTPFRVKEEIILKANSKSQIPNHKQIQNSNDQNSKQENLTFFFLRRDFGEAGQATGRLHRFLRRQWRLSFSARKAVYDRRERGEVGRGKDRDKTDIRCWFGKEYHKHPKSKNPIVSNGVFDALTGAMSELVNSFKSIGEGNVLSSGHVNKQKSWR